MVVGAQRLELLGVLLEVRLESVRVRRVQDLLDGVQRLHHHLPVLVGQLAQQDWAHHRRVQGLAGAREARQLVLGGLGAHSLRRAQLLHQLALVASVRHRRSRLDHGGLVRRRRGHRSGRRRGLARKHAASARLLRGLRRLGGSGHGRLRRGGAVAARRLRLRRLGLAEGTRGGQGGLRRLRGRGGVAAEGALGAAEPVVLGGGRGARATADALHARLGLRGHRGAREGVHGAGEVGAVTKRLVEEVVDGLLGRRLDGHVHSITLQRVQRARERQAVLDELVVGAHFLLEIDTTIHDQVLHVRNLVATLR